MSKVTILRWNLDSRCAVLAEDDEVLLKLCGIDTQDKAQATKWLAPPTAWERQPASPSTHWSPRAFQLLIDELTESGKRDEIKEATLIYQKYKKTRKLSLLRLRQAKSILTRKRR